MVVSVRFHPVAQHESLGRTRLTYLHLPCLHLQHFQQCRLASKGKGKTAKAETVPFKQASPMKKAPAAQGGTFYGTIGGKIPYVPVCCLLTPLCIVLVPKYMQF